MFDRQVIRLTLLDGRRPLYVRKASIVAFNRNQQDTATLVSTGRLDYAVEESVQVIFGLLLADC